MQVKKIRAKGKIFITPTTHKDSVLFTHCSGGELLVPTRRYNKEVEPLLFIHGVTYIYTTDKT